MGILAEKTETKTKTAANQRKNARTHRPAASYRRAKYMEYRHLQPRSRDRRASPGTRKKRIASYIHHAPPRIFNSLTITHSPRPLPKGEGAARRRVARGAGPAGFALVPAPFAFRLWRSWQRQGRKRGPCPRPFLFQRKKGCGPRQPLLLYLDPAIRAALQLNTQGRGLAPEMDPTQRRLWDESTWEISASSRQRPKPAISTTPG